MLTEYKVQRRFNWVFALVALSMFLFWFSVAYAVGHYVHRHHDVQYVSSCPRLPPHQQQGPIFS